MIIAMGRVSAARPTAPKRNEKMDKTQTMTMGTWIKVKFGTHQRLNDALGLGKNTVNRWYNTDPKRFFMHLPEMAKYGDTDPKELIEMIEQRCADVKVLRHGD